MAVTLTALESFRKDMMSVSYDPNRLRCLCRFLRRREQEIGSIVQSIEDLNTIFKDLALMVTEQVLNVVL
jgi:hypothetical protein